jgi:hypothetical protein
MITDDELAALKRDAARYRFLRSELASQYGIVQKEFWDEFQFKDCRYEKMDALIDGAMRLLKADSEIALAALRQNNAR